MTREELLALPAAVDLVTAGRALGIGRTTAHTLVRSGRWPTPVVRVGSSYRVPTMAILRLLEVVPEPAP
jgi:predicted site-specific integrase-resolvase